jgi:hypothetical protein
MVFLIAFLGFVGVMYVRYVDEVRILVLATVPHKDAL